MLGLSGGLDSVVLLHVLKEIESSAGFALSCIHVNHKISKNADNWADFCKNLCGIMAVPLEVVEVDISPHLAFGIEAAARTARYAAFEKLDADHLVLAQHRDDQAETVLLQLFRGAGLDGVAAMGVSAPFGKKTLSRPLLSVSRKALEAYAAEKNLAWVTDESNSDLRYDRNFVRHELIPAIENRFPACGETISRSALNFAESAALLAELAEIDASGAILDGCLAVSRLNQLSRARAKNLLRHYLFLKGMKMPSSRRLEEMLKQMQSPSACVEHEGFEIRSYRGFVHVVKSLPVPDDFREAWHGGPRMDIPALGGVLFFEKKAGGLDPGKLADVTVRARKGGESLLVHENRPRRSLKNLFQEHGIPPWQRKSLPLLYCGEHLVWVPELGLDPDYRAEPGQDGIVPRWQPISS